ncbi:MAG: aldo/keto reductase [Bacteroidetes bacterium]|nr:aldo/keto reductase [Bacteroidota bacterium]MBU1113712.1 aldo/keto reductase [Bacteroidota bacterium]MBU1798067.1 aldo/keto reductase [Bacteroidota bacterium]
MRYRKLGKTNIEVSEISLGCWTMGGLNWQDGSSIGWANVDESEINRAINYAIENGVTHFDNADNYGNGRAERMLARVLGERTSQFIISSKVGWFSGTAENSYEPAHIRHQCEQSLINLKRDYIDIYYFHHGYFGDNDEYLDEAVATMNRLKEEGKIRLIGQSAYSNEDFQKLVPIVKPDVLQSSANAIDDHYLADGTPVRNLLEENNISFIAFSPLAQGILLDKYNKDNPPQFESGDHRNRNERFKHDYLAKIEWRLCQLKERFGNSKKDLARAALQYLLHYQVVGSVIPGFRNLEQVKINLSAAENPLTDDDFNFIKTLFSEPI